MSSLIQSGNVVFVAPEEARPRSSRMFPPKVEREFGSAPPIVLRDAAGWRRLVDGNPFVTDDSEPDTLHVLCLSKTPGAAALARLEPKASKPDEFRVCGPTCISVCPQASPHQTDRCLVRFETQRCFDPAQLADVSRLAALIAARSRPPYRTRPRMLVERALSPGVRTRCSPARRDDRRRLRLGRRREPFPDAVDLARLDAHRRRTPSPRRCGSSPRHARIAN